MDGLSAALTQARLASGCWRGAASVDVLAVLRVSDRHEVDRSSEILIVDARA